MLFSAVSFFKKTFIKRLPSIMNKGVSISLNSDDPPFFNTTVGQEYYDSAKHFNLDIDKLKNMTIKLFLAYKYEDIIKKETLWYDYKIQRKIKFSKWFCYS